MMTGATADGWLKPQAAWYFRDEVIAVPQPEAANDPPPLIWLGASQIIDGARLSEHGMRLATDGGDLDLELCPRHPLNRAYFDVSSHRFLARRTLRLRGEWNGKAFVARTFWPGDHCLDQLPTRPQSPPISTPESLRAWVRSKTGDAANDRFSVETLWQRAGPLPPAIGAPVIAFILNGAQGDDDEAHAGHFATAIGTVGENGAMHDWLVANYYTLDSESEKGILASSVPLDNYLGDLNAGQSWYRPSWMLVARLRDPRAARCLQSAFSTVFDRLYCRRLHYHHASANCAGIIVSTLRALGWAVPARGPEGWLKAVVALPATLLASGSLKKAKAAFDYLTEDRTRLYPAAAFEETGADLLQLVRGTSRRHLSRFEAMLASDVDEVLLVRLPQFPSSRAWGDYPVIDSREYHDRLPKNPADRQIVPVGPRPLPPGLEGSGAARAPLQRSDYALIAAALGAGLAWLGSRVLRRRRRSGS